MSIFEFGIISVGLMWLIARVARDGKKIIKKFNCMQNISEAMANGLAVEPLRHGMKYEN